MDIRTIDMNYLCDCPYWTDCTLPNLDVEIKESYSFDNIEITFKQNNDDISTFKFNRVENNEELIDACNEDNDWGFTSIYLITDIVINERFYDAKKMQGLFHFSITVAIQDSFVNDVIIANTKLLDKFPKDTIKTIFLLKENRITFQNEEYFKHITDPTLCL